MSNVTDPEKERITYGEFSDVREDLEGIASDLGSQEGREVSISEIIRTMTLELANKRRKTLGQPLLQHDPSTKPGGTPKRRNVTSGAR